MSMKDELGMAKHDIAKLETSNLKLEEENRVLKEEVRHFQKAVAAVKWLWEQAQKQQPFQL